jgi:hypothetical protein
LIGRENPDYEVLFLRPAAEKFYEEALAGRLSDTDVAQLRGVATELLAKIQLAGGTLA